MWEHVKARHEAKVLEFDDKKKAISAKIAELQESIPSLYSTEQQGKVERGSWTI